MTCAQGVSCNTDVDKELVENISLQTILYTLNDHLIRTHGKFYHLIDRGLFDDHPASKNAVILQNNLLLDCMRVLTLVENQKEEFHLDDAAKSYLSTFIGDIQWLDTVKTDAVVTEIRTDADS